jgi:hypothetical protein
VDEDRKTWIRASKLYRQLTKGGEHPDHVESRIAIYLRNADLKARASARWESDARFPAKAWRSCPEDAEGGIVPAWVWRLEKNILEDRAQWRFIANRFLMTKTLKPRRRVMMRGVEFFIPDLERLMPNAFLTDHKPAHKGTGRGKRPHVGVDWDAILAPYWAKAKQGRLGDLIGATHVRGAAVSLKNLIVNDLDDSKETPGDSTIFRKIAPILKLDRERFRAPTVMPKETIETNES